MRHKHITLVFASGENLVIFLQIDLLIKTRVLTFYKSA